MKARLPIFDLAARAYDHLTAQPLWREQIESILQHYQGDREAPRVLDLGCGPGVSSFVLAEALGPRATVIGIDNAARMIDCANRWHRTEYAHLGNVEFRVADATHMDFADDSFDLAVGHSFLYLVPDRLGVLKEVKRVLAPGATLALMEPSRQGSIVTAARTAWTRRSLARGRLYGALRFATSMLAWRIASAAAGRLDPKLVDELFKRGGLGAATCHPTLGSLGMHCIAHTP